MKKRCYIFAAGDFCGKFERENDSLIIAADAGYHHLERLGIMPDVLIGDFDTIGEIPTCVCTIKFPAEKDYTDTELAIIEGINRGYSDFVICGSIGGKRLEHTVANLALASSYAQKGYSILLTDGSYNVLALHNGKAEFDSSECGFVSVFALSGKASGVCEHGLKYSLKDGVLDSSNPTLCVSNEFCGRNSFISVEDGTIIIIWQKRHK